MENNPDRHFYLYAKHWYVRNNILEDLRKIVHFRCGAAESIRINDSDVVIVLIGVVGKHVSCSEHFEHFIRSMDSTLNVTTSILKACLLKLSNTKTSEIPFELGKPNNRILRAVKG